MIRTYNKQTVTVENGVTKYLADIYCNSDDTKPTENLANGSKLTEVDTGKTYLFDEDNEEWVEYSAGGGGGGGGGTEEPVLKCVGTFDENTGNTTLDKTYAEIMAAMQSGKPVFVNVQFVDSNVQTFFIVSVELGDPYIIGMFGGANSSLYSAEVANTSDYPVFPMD